jgi:hypothetical protein
VEESVLNRSQQQVRGRRAGALAAGTSDSPPAPPPPQAFKRVALALLALALLLLAALAGGALLLREPLCDRYRAAVPPALRISWRRDRLTGAMLAVRLVQALCEVQY